MELNQYYDNSKLYEYTATKKSIDYFKEEGEKKEFTAKKIKPQKAVDECPDGNDCLL